MLVPSHVVEHNPDIEAAMRAAIDGISELWRIANDPWSRWTQKYLLTPEAIEVEISCIREERRLDGLPDIPNPQLKAQAIANIEQQQTDADAASQKILRRAELAKYCLGSIAKVARNRDSLFAQAGRPCEARHTRSMLEILGNLANDTPVFHIAIDKVKEPGTERVPDGSAEKKRKALRVELKRFCERVDAALRAHFLHPEGKTVAFCTPERITDGMIRNTFSSWPGVRFPADIPAFREAVNYHAQLQLRKSK